MNPGPLEEGAKVAAGFMESMKSQPLSLALVLMNVALLLFFYFIVQAAETRAKVHAEQTKQVMQLLANCRGMP